MGRRSQYKRKFLKNHPICCFCGGETASSTIDHIPSRAMFFERAWPEGYEFPSCGKCNPISAQHEQIIALIARMATDDDSPEAFKEFQSLLQGVENNHPLVLREMQPSSNQVRQFLRAQGIRLGNGLSSRQIPILSVRGPLVRATIDSFARKLFLALHYLHTGIIVPHSGGVAMKWITNTVPENTEFINAIEQLRNGLPNSPELKRSNTRLEEQFSYKYFVNSDKLFSAYFVTFRKSFAMIGVVRLDSVDFPEVMREFGLLKPFIHDNSI